MYKTSLACLWRGTQLNFNVSYIASRPMIFLNDLRLPPCWRANATIAHDFAGIGFALYFRVSSRINNLFSTHYIRRVCGAAPFSGDSNSDLSVGSPPQFIGMVSARF